MSLDLKSLELFIRVAACGAIGKAGAAFGLSPTAATQRIQALEKSVGAQLLHRSTRSVSLSSDGEVFLAHAKRILAGVEDALADVQNEPQAVRGTLRIAGSASFGRKHIAPYMAEFLDRHPAVKLELHLTDAVVDIVEDGFDLAVRLGSLAPSSLKAKRIGSSPRIVVAAPTYIERFGRPEHPDDLQTHNCLARGGLRSWSLRGVDGRQIEASIAGNFSCNFSEAITEAVLSGLGIATKCKWEIDAHLNAGRLTTLLDDYTVMPEWDVFAVRSPSRIQPTRIRAFVAFLEETYKSVPALQKSDG
ncbi:MAG: LysR substrate-binding domain-containing protein [Pseudomonadota bacterium]